MQKKIVEITALALFLTTGSAWAGCEYPDEPSAPDASKATVEELQAAIAVFKEFQVALEEYRSCLEEDFNSLDEEAQTKERRELHNRRHDSSVDREMQLAELLNEQIRQWQAANQTDDSQTND